MAPLIVLVVVALLARLIGQLGVAHLRDWAASTRFGLAVMLCFTAAAHFNSMRPDMVAMVPPSVPNPEFMVTFTGICEIVGAVGLLVPRTRRIAAVALIVFMLAVLPANIYAAQAGVTFRDAPATPIIPRVALQVLFIALLWWSGVRAPRSRKDAAQQQVGVSPDEADQQGKGCRGSEGEAADVARSTQILEGYLLIPLRFGPLMLASPLVYVNPDAEDAWLGRCSARCRFIGELLFTLWLLIKGVNVERWRQVAPA